MEDCLDDLLIPALETFPSFVIVDRAGKILYINENYTKILGTSKYAAIGRDVAEVIAGTRLPAVLKSGKEEIGALMTFFDHGAGKNITLVCNRIPVSRGGVVIGAIGQTAIKDTEIVSGIYEELRALKKENAHYKSELTALRHALHPFENFVGESWAFLAVKNALADYADTALPVLLTGETGVGKEPAAKALHHLSARRLNNYIKINCAAIPDDLLESELFGYADGAFTGARKGGKPGKFELADNGTLLLDEIGEMSLYLQAKLLRVLQEGEYERVGGTAVRKANVRLVCSTNKNLEQLAREGRFREDLYYRINTVEIKIPPLRERTEDIAPLARYFIAQVRRKTGKAVYDIAPAALERFASYPWPGNVRELEHVIERAAVMCRDEALREEDFGFLWEKAGRIGAAGAAGAAPPRRTDLREYVGRAEKQALEAALEQTGGNKSAAARLLNIDRSLFYGKLRKHHLL